jgi:CTP:molybdopterin cytidylyltransferase MocA
VECAAWADGLAASLRCGLQTAVDEERVLLLLGDQPLVDPSLIEQFTREPPGSRAAWNGAPSHPAVLGPKQIQAAKAATGDEGLKTLTWRLVEVDRPLRDIDTPEDLEDVRREARAIV